MSDIRVAPAEDAKNGTKDTMQGRVRVESAEVSQQILIRRCVDGMRRRGYATAVNCINKMEERLEEQ